MRSDGGAEPIRWHTRVQGLRRDCRSTIWGGFVAETGLNRGGPPLLNKRFGSSAVSTPYSTIPALEIAEIQSGKSGGSEQRHAWKLPKWNPVGDPFRGGAFTTGTITTARIAAKDRAALGVALLRHPARLPATRATAEPPCRWRRRIQTWFLWRIQQIPVVHQWEELANPR